MESQQGAQRRIALWCDQARYDVAAPATMTLEAVLRGVGAAVRSADPVVHDRAGAQFPLTRMLGEFADGDVLSVVDLGLAPAARGRRRARPVGHGDAHARRPEAALVVVGALSILVAPAAAGISSVLAAVLGAVAAAGAVATGTVWARRLDAGGTADGAVGALLLAFAAGLLLAPAVPAGAVSIAVACGWGAVAVLAAVLSLVCTPRAATGALATAAILTGLLAALWALTALLGMTAGAACALTLAAAPVALRVLPTTLLNVQPGMFLDFARFQTLRWAVRQRRPEPARTVSTAQAQTLVGRARAQWLTGTAVWCTAVAASAPAALVPWRADDVLVASGQLALAACTGVALALHSRRMPAGLLRWMPRAAAASVLVSAAAALVPRAVSAGGLLAAVVLLAAAVAVALVALPAAAGARSLFWSRLGDVVEALAVALALPAGMLAASVLTLVRGMMAS